MKKINADFNGDLFGLRSSIKVVGSIGSEPDVPLCILSEKNLISILKTLGAISPQTIATKFADRLKVQSFRDDFTALKYQNMLNEQLEDLQFSLDCGELLVGNDSKIKEFLQS